MVNRFGVVQISKEAGISETTVYNYLRLLHLHPRVEDALELDVISPKDAVALSSLSKDDQLAALSTKKKGKALLVSQKLARKEEILSWFTSVGRLLTLVKTKELHNSFSRRYSATIEEFNLTATKGEVEAAIRQVLSDLFNHLLGPTKDPDDD